MNISLIAVYWKKDIKESKMCQISCHENCYRKYSVDISMRDSALPGVKGGPWVMGFLI
jgi:hypothetical protein